MSTAGRPAADAPAADDVARACREAGLVLLRVRPDGDALAATGLLARALAATGTPFQTRVGRDTDARTEADATVAIGAGGDVRIPAALTPASVTAFEAARELGTEPDPVLALAGVVAADRVPGEYAALLDAAREGGSIERRPGIAVPTADVTDGLAHTTLAHASFSGDTAAADAAVSDLALPDDPEERDRRRIASLLALAVVESEDATSRAAEAVERALRPYALDGPFATLGGYADVLCAVARERPGTGIALALGHDARAAALDAWRDHARRAHAGVREATTARYSGLVVARAGDAPVETTARLVRDFRSPEPVALVVGDGEAAAAAVDDRAMGDLLCDAAASVDGEADGNQRRGYARFGADATEAFVTAVREAI